MNMRRSEIEVPEYAPHPADSLAAEAGFKGGHDVRDGYGFAKIDPDRSDCACLANGHTPISNLIEQRVQGQRRVVQIRCGAGDKGFRHHDIEQEFNVPTSQVCPKTVDRLSAWIQGDIDALDALAVPIEVVAEEKRAV